MLKIDVLPYSIRELWIIADGLQEADEAQWNHTSALMAVIANVHRDKKQRPMPYHPNEFHPYRLRKVKSGVPLDGSLIRNSAAHWYAARGIEYDPEVRGELQGEADVLRPPEGHQPHREGEGKEAE
jgi:hypothetical protein